MTVRRRIKPPKTSRERRDGLFHLPDAARQLGISASTLKQWIYHGQIRSVRTPGGHHRIPCCEIERLAGAPAEPASETRGLAAISGRNKLYGTIERVQYGGLLAEVTIAVGNQVLTAIITSASCRALRLKRGVAAYGLVNATEVMVVRA